MRNKDKEDGERYSVLDAFTFVSGIGIHCALTIGVCVFLGLKADAYFSLGSWGTIGGIVIGFWAAIWSTYKNLLGKRK